MFFGSGASLIAFTFVSAVCTPCASIPWPKYSTEPWENEHTDTVEPQTIVLSRRELSLGSAAAVSRTPL